MPPKKKQQRQQQQVVAPAAAAADDGQQPKECIIVYVPADTNKPIVEWTIAMPKGKEVSCVGDRIRQHFAESDKRGHLNAAQQKQRLAAVRESLAKNNVQGAESFPDELLMQVLAMSSVDIVPLLQNTKENDYIAVNLYVDDQGIAKGLPFNPRASAIALQANSPLRVLGDAFISRIYDDEDTFRRLDFRLKEDLTPDADWMIKAAAANQKRREADMASAAAAAKPAGGAAEAGAVVEDEERCAKGFLASCHNEAKLKCSGCGTIKYCTKVCQRADWKRHKTECKRA